jgi:mono/diheme cytochrome c family protein
VREILKSTTQIAAALCVATAGMSGFAGCTTTATEGHAVPDAAARGKAIYEQHCVGCHGQLGTGDAFQAVPALAGQRMEYLRLQIEQFSTNQRHSSRMQWAFNRFSMTEPESADVATFLSGLPMQRFADSDSRHRWRGEKIYLEHCVDCHGANALGSADGAVPSLRDQHDSYLVDRLRRFASTSPNVSVAEHAVADADIVTVSAYLSSLPGMNLKSR